MAQNNNTNDIIFDIKVKYKEAIEEIAKLKVKNEELREAEKKQLEELKKTNASREEYNKVMAETKARIDHNNKSIQAYNKEIQDNMKYEKEQEGSLNKLKAALSSMTAEYNKMSEAQRKDEGGKDLQKRIADTTAKLKEEEEALGNFHRSVGNYAQAGAELKKEMKEIIDSLAGMRLAGEQNTEQYREMTGCFRLQRYKFILE